MAEFDYYAAAELFPTRRRLPRRQSFGYKRFEQAAQAIHSVPSAANVGVTCVAQTRLASAHFGSLSAPW